MREKWDFERKTKNIVLFKKQTFSRQITITFSQNAIFLYPISCQFISMITIYYYDLLLSLNESIASHLSNTQPHEPLGLSRIRVANPTKGWSVCHVYSGRTRRVGKSMAFSRPSRCSPFPRSRLSFSPLFRSSPFFLPPIFDDGSFSWNEFCWLSNGSLFLSLSSFLSRSLPLISASLFFSPDGFDPSLQQ